MPVSAPLTTVYATDEQLQLLMGIDYISMAMDSARLAYGKDGVFGDTDPWTLTSATVDFEAQGVTSGSVMYLSAPASAFPRAGQLLAVDSVSSGSALLRRCGLGSSVGQPPGPTAGVTGVEFLCVTYGPLLEEESFQINQKYSIDPAYPGRTPSDAYDLRPLRRATILRVMLDRYTLASQAGSGDYAVKIDQARFQLGEVEAKLQLRWGTSPTAPQVTNAFGTRVIR